MTLEAPLLESTAIPEETRPSVAVIILNWNAWADTIECLESLRVLDYPNAHVFICENASTDGSAMRLRQWLQGDLCGLPKSPAFAAMVGAAPRNCTGPSPDWANRFTLIENSANLGFAGGNNVGLAKALAEGFDYFWVLNADTVVDPQALTHLVLRIEADDRAGLCGSLLCYYDAPEVVQEAGGCAFYPLVGLSRRLAADVPRERQQNWRRLEAKLGYISGASCLVSRPFLEHVGPMSEDYFLYCEEIDWAMRARGKFALVLAEQSVVYHKKGLATGSKGHAKGRSAGSSYYLWRSRRRFSQRYNRMGLPGLFLAGGATALVSLVKGDQATAKAILNGLANREPTT